MALITAAALAFGVAGAATANGDSNRNSFKANLGGYQEVPAISTTGTGSLKVSVNPAGTELSYTLTFSGLQGGSVLAAHIHFAQSSVSGAVVAFLCGGGGKPACPPAAGGTVTGTIVAADIIAVPAQGIAAGDLAAVLKAMRHGVTYANVHSTAFPGGEIRGHIRAHGKGDKDHD
ncbi:MAG: CHRD domain-containing protein [Candidatus Limnocylindrales bacterium]|nr:CHRD domain-containing protein [Candidatus Limnocylindrales bacterium]